MWYKSLIRPLLFTLDAEQAHHLTTSFASNVASWKMGRQLIETLYHFEDRRLSQKIGDLFFINPIGIAAGFDKNAHYLQVLSAQGVGHVEVGSATAQASNGNPKPRAFRLPQDQGLINRMGLNNDGIEQIAPRIIPQLGPVQIGLNIAKTHNPNILGTKAIDDYLLSFSLAEKSAAYITVNVSCPNTEEGKTFESPEAFTDLISAISQARMSQKQVFIKLSVDLDRADAQKLVEIALSYGMNGFVATNTSSLRQGLSTSEDKLEKIGKGGLSGSPIAKRSTEVIRWVREAAGANIPIIGVGGISSLETAIEKIKAGANLLQLYTGMIYQGPGLVKQLKKGIAEYMDKFDVEHLDDLRIALNEL